MSNVDKVKHFSDGEDISTVTNCKFLVVHITNDSYSNEEIKKKISWSKAEMSNSIKIMDGSTNTKV
jgi:hypothetical protein